MDRESRKGKILVVDDSPPILDVLRDTLESEGYRIYVATSGEKALSRALQSMPDLILLDVLMPGMDGFETCRCLKADEKTGEIPVIFMTGLTDTAHKVRGFEVGGVDYVTKPIEISELVARVTMHLSIHAMQEQLKAQNERLQQEIAERERVEEKVHTLNIELEQRVEERTTELRSANEQLRQTHLRLERSLRFTEALLSAIPTPVFYKDTRGRYLGCNRAFTEIMGVTPEQIMDKTVHELWPSEHAEVYHQKDLELMNTPVRQIYEFKVRDKDGVERNVIYAKDVFRDENEQVAGIVGAFADITDRKRAEDALWDERSMFIGGPTVVFKWKAEEGWPVEYISPNVLDQFGYTALDFTSGRILYGNIIHPDDLEQVSGEVTNYSKSGIPSFEQEYRIIRSDGTYRWLHDFTVVRRNNDGNITHYQGYVQDITERKLMEEALQNSSERIRFFAYSVSHDLKSPAVSIYGLTKLLTKHYRDWLDEKGQHYCDQIMKTAEQITTLVEKINLFISTKQSPLNIEKVNPREVLQMVKDEFANQLSIRRIDWLEPEYIPEINADRLGVLRILRNLVDNALKYGGDDLSEIRIAYAESDRFHILSVSDDGAGIRKESSEKIFDPFQRDEITRGVEGTGLGLAIVREIVDQHGGKVWVESEPEQGTTFHVSIARDLGAP